MDADLLPPAGDGWHSLAVVRDGNAMALGAARPGAVPDTSSFSFRCRWPVVDESFSMSQRNSPYDHQGSA